MTKTILGISLGTRSIGFAIIRNGDLIDWKLQSFKGIWSEEKKHAILQAIQKTITTNNIQLVAMKSVDLVHSSTELNELTEDLENILSKKEVPCIRYTIHDLKNYCAPQTKGNKSLLLAYVKQRYPEFAEICEKDELNNRHYYVKMIEAIIACLYAETNNRK